MYFHYQIAEKPSSIPYLLDPQPVDSVCYVSALPIFTGPLFLQLVKVRSGKGEQQTELPGDFGPGLYGPRIVEPSGGLDLIASGVDLQNQGTCLNLFGERYL